MRLSMKIGQLRHDSVYNVPGIGVPWQITPSTQGSHRKNASALIPWQITSQIIARDIIQADGPRTRLHV